LNRLILDYINRSESGEAAPAEAVAPATGT
jgi:hypothetical protein